MGRVSNNAHPGALSGRVGCGQCPIMSTDLTVINAAATRTGNEPVTNLSTDTTAVGKIARENYENLVKAHLAMAPWKTATKTAVLARIDADVHGEPPEPWTAAYTRPTDLVEIRTVKVDGQVIPYEIHGNTILCDAAVSQDAIIHYVWRVPESQWPPVFREFMIQTLEPLFLRGAGERYREADARDESAKDWGSKARARDAQSQTARDPVSSPALAARGGLQPPTVRAGLRR